MMISTAQKWLFVAAALVLLPSPAFAQKKRGAKPTTTVEKQSTETTTTTETLELDEEPSSPSAPTEKGVATPAPLSAGGGICEIDPSACPKEQDVRNAASRAVEADIYAVQQIYALRARRFELQPYWGLTLNDQFVSHPGPGLAANYYILDVLAVGINGNLYTGLNVDSVFNFQNRRATHLSLPLNEYQWNANVNVTYVPIYGKFAGFGDFIFHYDAYIVGGAGAISTRPIPIIDADNRNFKWRVKPAFNAGIGVRVFFNRWFAINLEVRDYIFNEQLESLQVATTARGSQDPGTWYGESRLTNNVQAQLGISIFLPISWEYRLPK